MGSPEAPKSAEPKGNVKPKEVNLSVAKSLGKLALGGGKK